MTNPRDAFSGQSSPNIVSLPHMLYFSKFLHHLYIDKLPARRRPQGLVVIGVCLSVCLSVCVCVCVCALFLSARYLKNGFMNHHQIRWVGAGGEPLEEV